MPENDIDDMKEEYDFTGGVRGKFHSPNLKLKLPIYLDDDTLAFIEAIADKKGTELSDVVNELIRTNIRLADVIRG